MIQTAQPIPAPVGNPRHAWKRQAADQPARSAFCTGMICNQRQACDIAASFTCQKQQGAVQFLLRASATARRDPFLDPPARTALESAWPKGVDNACHSGLIDGPAREST